MSKIMKSNNSEMIVINIQLWNDFQVSNDSAAESSVFLFDCSSNMSTSISQSVQFGEYPGLASSVIISDAVQFLQNFSWNQHNLLNFNLPKFNEQIIKFKVCKIVKCLHNNNVLFQSLELSVVRTIICVQKHGTR